MYNAGVVVVNSEVVRLAPGYVANWIQSYDRELLKIYISTSSLVRLEKKSPTMKNALAYYNTGFAVENFEVVGLAPDTG
jgi:hypothetical protein